MLELSSQAIHASHNPLCVTSGSFPCNEWQLQQVHTCAVYMPQLSRHHTLCLVNCHQGPAMTRQHELVLHQRITPKALHAQAEPLIR